MSFAKIVKVLAGLLGFLVKNVKAKVLFKNLIISYINLLVLFVMEKATQ